MKFNFHPQWFAGKLAGFKLKWLPFSVSLVVVLSLNLANPVTTLTGDASGYLLYADHFIVDNHFSLLNYKNALRGYLFPLLLRIPLLISRGTGVDVLVVFRITAAVAAALTIAVIIPAFFQKLFHFQANPAQKLLFALLMIYFWHDHFAYPLTDVPALSFFFFGALLFLHGMDGKPKPAWMTALLTFLAGMFMAAAVNLRQGYLYSFLLFLVFFFIRVLVSQDNWLRKWIIGSFCAAGIILVLLPQLLINGNAQHIFTPFSINKYQGQDLFLYQLYKGLEVQRIDFGASVNGEVTPRAAIIEQQGQKILDEHQFKLDETWTFRRYIKLAYQNPFDFATLYFRHLFDGLDIVYSSPYVVDIYQSRILFRFLNYSLWFLALFALWKSKIGVRQHLQQIFLLGLIALPALMTVPGVIETRFFLPLFALMYAWICFWIFSSWSIFSKEHRKRWLTWQNAIAYGGFVAACFAFSSLNFSAAGILLF